MQKSCPDMKSTQELNCCRTLITRMDPRLITQLLIVVSVRWTVPCRYGLIDVVWYYLNHFLFSHGRTLSNSSSSEWTNNSHLQSASRFKTSLILTLLFLLILIITPIMLQYIHITPNGSHNSKQLSISPTTSTLLHQPQTIPPSSAHFCITTHISLYSAYLCTFLHNSAWLQQLYTNLHSSHYFALIRIDPTILHNSCNSA